MAAGILAATGVVKPALVEDAIALGELSLDGRIQPVAVCCRWCCTAGVAP